MSIEYIYEVNVSELTDSSQDKIWSEVLKKGQDACCLKCKHQMRMEDGEREVLPSAVGCEKCQEMHPPEMFSSEAVLSWTGETTSEEPVVCRKCLGLKQITTQTAVDMVYFKF